MTRIDTLVLIIIISGLMFYVGCDGDNGGSGSGAPGPEQMGTESCFPGDGYPNPDAFGLSGHGPGLSYTDNGDGTFTDNITNLVWEKKTDDGTVHDVDNTYTWSTCGVPPEDPCPPNGTVFTDFLDELNDVAGGGQNCFAGYCDWCLPNVKMLLSIVDYSTCSTCDSGSSASSVPGLTAAAVYWSSTTDAGFTNTAWLVFFDYGGVAASGKGQSARVRAVRPCE